jgi:septal ring factor EnvC (AmiA/AmiB activator)
MPEWFLVIAAIISLGGGAFGAVNGYRTMKRTSPIEEVKKEAHNKWKSFYDEKWDKLISEVEQIKETVRNVDSERNNLRFDEISRKLDNDNRRISTITDATKQQQRFLVLLLKSQQQSLVHMSVGNHVAALRQVSEEITDFLLNEATRCDL